jgi:uncharacterized membrane protein YgdD (TMEM256/DUF423 family)
MKSTMDISRITLLLSGLFGFICVALGAFGAHALKATLLQHQMLDVWQTAVNYQAFHTAALLGVSALLGLRRYSQKLLFATALCWSIAIVLFSGSLYALALGAPAWTGFITPLGGLSFMAGWVLLIITALRR